MPTSECSFTSTMCFLRLIYSDVGVRYDRRETCRVSTVHSLVGCSQRTDRARPVRCECLVHLVDVEIDRLVDPGPELEMPDQPRVYRLAVEQLTRQGSDTLGRLLQQRPVQAVEVNGVVSQDGPYL